MKKNNILIFTIIIISSFILTSCSNKNLSKNAKGKIFPIPLGTWSLFQKFSNGNIYSANYCINKKIDIGSSAKKVASNYAFSYSGSGGGTDCGNAKWLINKPYKEVIKFTCTDTGLQKHDAYNVYYEIVKYIPGSNYIKFKYNFLKPDIPMIFVYKSVTKPNSHPKFLLEYNLSRIDKKCSIKYKYTSLYDDYSFGRFMDLSDE